MSFSVFLFSLTFFPLLRSKNLYPESPEGTSATTLPSSERVPSMAPAASRYQPFPRSTFLLMMPLGLSRNSSTSFMSLMESGTSCGFTR